MSAASPISLTIGIPTYNFGPYLAVALDAFLIDLPDGVEILVVDGASTDDTADIVAERQSLYPMLRYVRLPQRGGIDADIATTVDLAQGEYVWLFSADDVALPGAVRAAQELLRGRPDVLVLAHSGCSAEMVPVHDRYPIITGPDLRARLHDAASRDAYLSRAVTTEALFSFLSGLVIRRAAWNAAPVERDFFFGSCWAHAARLLAITTGDGLDVQVHTAPLLQRRADNDSFLTHGIVARYALAIEGWNCIFAAIFGGDAPELRQLQRILRNEFGLPNFLRAKLFSANDPADGRWLTRQFDMLYGKSPRDRVYRAVLKHAPLPAINLLFGAKRAFDRIRR